MEKVRAYINEHASRFVEELQEVCRVPSIAAQDIGMQETAELLRQKMEQVGIKAQVIQVPGGHPVVYGELLGQGERTILFYNHYDAQPPEPLEEWKSDPFAAEVRDGRIYARGVADNKGNAMARIKAVEAYLKTHGKLPVNVKFVVEGEEEIGSPSIGRFVEAHKDLLKADACVWEAGYRDIDDHPEIVVGMKGMVYVELTARGANRDMHSAHATTVVNPAWRLIWALSSLKNEQEEILVEGFYDDIAEPTAEDYEAMHRLPFNEEAELKELGLQSWLNGLTGLGLKKRKFFGPTCTVCGFVSGYTGKGQKTVLPAVASCKIDFRLVPNQSPDDILAKIEKHLVKHGFDDIEVRLLSSEHPAKTALTSEITRVVAGTVEEAYGIEPVLFPLSLGTGPMYHFSEVLGLPTVSTGVGNAHSNMHAPNENVRVADYLNGIAHIALIMREFGQGGEGA